METLLRRRLKTIPYKVGVTGFDVQTKHQIASYLSASVDWTLLSITAVHAMTWNLHQWVIVKFQVRILLRPRLKTIPYKVGVTGFDVQTKHQIASYLSASVDWTLLSITAVHAMTWNLHQWVIVKFQVRILLRPRLKTIPYKVGVTGFEPVSSD